MRTQLQPQIHDGRNCLYFLLYSAFCCPGRLTPSEPVYDSPKTLPCLHSFCLKCIQQLPVDLQKEKYVIVCPTCRKTAHLPDNGPANLPTAFLINNLKDIQEKLKKATESSSRDKQISCDNCEGRRATRYCKQCAFGFCEKCLGIHNGLRARYQHRFFHQTRAFDELHRP